MPPQRRSSRLTADQTKGLKEAYVRNRDPSPLTKRVLSTYLRLSVKEVTTWFVRKRGRRRARSPDESSDEEYRPSSGALNMVLRRQREIRDQQLSRRDDQNQQPTTHTSENKDEIQILENPTNVPNPPLNEGSVSQPSENGPTAVEQTVGSLPWVLLPLDQEAGPSNEVGESRSENNPVIAQQHAEDSARPIGPGSWVLPPNINVEPHSPIMEPREATSSSETASVSDRNVLPEPQSESSDIEIIEVINQRRPITREPTNPDQNNDQAIRALQGWLALDQQNLRRAQHVTEPTMRDQIGELQAISQMNRNALERTVSLHEFVAERERRQTRSREIFRTPKPDGNLAPEAAVSRDMVESFGPNGLLVEEEEVIGIEETIFQRVLRTKMVCDICMTHMKLYRCSKCLYSMCKDCTTTITNEKPGNVTCPHCRESQKEFLQLRFPRL